MYMCPYTDCPFRADDGDDVDDHVAAAHLGGRSRKWAGDE